MKKLLLSLAAFAMTLAANAQEITENPNLKLYLTLDQPLVKGGEAVVTLHESDATTKYAGFKITPKFSSADVKVKYDDDEEDYVYSLNAARSNGHSITFGSKGESLVAYGSKNFKTVDGDDALASFTIVADANFTGGDLSVTNVQFSDKTGNMYTNTIESISLTQSTGISSVEANVDKTPVKYVENNKVVISKNGKKYNAVGSQLK